MNKMPRNYPISYHQDLSKLPRNYPKKQNGEKDE